MLIEGREKSENTVVSGGKCTCRPLMLQKKSENATVSGDKPELRASAVGSKTGNVRLVAVDAGDE